MNGASVAVGKGPSEVHTGRATIDLVCDLWAIECRHQLGILSRAAYLQAVAARRRAAQPREENKDE
ncbi:MAG: hypothetical protein H6R15_3079 [Proteobacteria bacterium]|nr:hypothetical protein [Pseudomonadota bacterium]